MKFDTLLLQLGEFGPYQRRVFLCSAMFWCVSSIQAFMVIFTMAVPDSRCAIPGLKNDTYISQGNHHKKLILYALPINGTRKKLVGNTGWGDAHCFVYKNRNVTTYSDLTKSGQTVETTNETAMKKCGDWVFDKSDFENTLVTDYDLICDDTKIRDQIVTVLFTGEIFGAIIFGYLSDRFGRKKVLIIAYLIVVVDAFVRTLADNLIFNLIIRFLVTMGSDGVLMTSFLLATELCGPNYRAKAGVAIGYFWIIAEFVLLSCAYTIRSWRLLSDVLGVMIAFLGVLLLKIPESPRWQVSMCKIAKATKTMTKVAKSNGQTLPSNAFDGEIEVLKHPEAKSTLLTQIMNYPNLWYRFFVIAFNWSTISVIYYGLTLTVGTAKGNIFDNFLYSCAVEFPAITLTYFAIVTLGRKRYQCFVMIIAGFAFVSLIVLIVLNVASSPTTLLILSSIGKFAITCGFANLFVFAADLFPTFMRNTVMGAAAMLARIFTLLAPQIGGLSHYVHGVHGEVLPFIVFGSLCFTSGLLALTLPETLGQHAPETYKDAVNLENPNIMRESVELSDIDEDEAVKIGYYCNRANIRYSTNR